MMPLPSLIEADAYDIDGSSDSDCEGNEIKCEILPYKNGGMKGQSIGCFAASNESLDLPVDCRPDSQNYENFQFQKQLQQEDTEHSFNSAAAIDILESDPIEVWQYENFGVNSSEHFPYPQMLLAGVESCFDHSSENVNPELRTTTKFLDYVSSIIPRIMVRSIL
jgi:hypothetical protein